MNSTSISLHDAFDLFITFKTAERRSQNTLDWYSHMLNHFFAFVGADTPAETIKPVTIAQFIVAQANAGHSEHTLDARYRALSAFFNWLETSEDAGRPASPIGTGKHKKVSRPGLPQRAPRRTTHQEVQTLLDAIPLNSWVDARDKAIIMLLFTTALRRSELLSLSLDNLDLSNHFAKVIGKGDIERFLPLEFDTRFALFAYLMARPPYEGNTLWLGSTSGLKPRGPFGKSGLRFMLERRCDTANIRYLNPHAFRHGGATYMLNHGADITFVQNLLGHSSPLITEKLYARWLNDGMKATHDRIWRQRNA